MKKLLLIIIPLLVLAGCGGRYIGPGAAPQDYTDATQDNAQQAEVRAWLTTELYRIREKRAVVDDMFKTQQISYAEYFALLEECDEEKRTILQRVPKHLTGGYAY